MIQSWACWVVSETSTCEWVLNMLSWVSWETSTCWLTWHRTEFRRSFLLIFRVEVLSVKCVSASSPSPELLKSALEWQDLVKTPSVSVGGNEARVRVKHSAHLKRNICVTKLKICVLCSHVTNECRIFIQVIFAPMLLRISWIKSVQAAAESQYLEEHLMNPSGDKI